MIFERDSLSTVICNIRTPVGNSEETGTAIFIEKNNEPFLLTASHVLGNLSDNSYAVLSDKNGAPSKVPLSILLGGATFIHHNKADLAKAKINITLLNAHFWRGRCFLYDLINTTTNLVSKDTELTTIGFPLGLGVEGQKFSPLSFRTFAASPMITLPRFDNKNPCDFIILETPSAGGYSGGPVFDLGYVISGSTRSNTGGTRLHGIVHGTLFDQTGGKLAAITPCKYLDGWI